MNSYPCVKVNGGIQNTGRLCKTILKVNILKKQGPVYMMIEDMEITQFIHPFGIYLWSNYSMGDFRCEKISVTNSGKSPTPSNH